MAYGSKTALHYEAYRPSLHRLILERALPAEQKFDAALDIGCGVGHSSLALDSHATRVLGQDVSPDMIHRAERYASANLSFTNQSLAELAGKHQESFDLITFAGSLFYQDPTEVWRQLESLAAKRAYVCVYDFDVELQSIFNQLGYGMPEGDYDHRRNFDGQELGNFSPSGLQEFTHHFTCSARELAHLLFSVEEWQSLFAPQQFDAFTARLHREIGASTDLTARCFYSVYYREE